MTFIDWIFVALCILFFDSGLLVCIKQVMQEYKSVLGTEQQFEAALVKKEAELNVARSLLQADKLVIENYHSVIESHLATISSQSSLISKLNSELVLKDSMLSKATNVVCETRVDSKKPLN